MGKIYIRTYAYNAEKTLPRAVESVLNQTYGDFVYYLCDNGSTDGTHEICEAYARSDRRIRFFYNRVNRDYRQTQECLFLSQHIADDDYYCTLDADDEYLPDFFSDMLAFMDTNRLDIGACGSDFLNAAQNNRLTGKRMLPQSLILEGNNFAKYFPQYHVFMRTVWGKLFKGRTARSMIQDPETLGFPRAYGGDTYNTMRAFSKAKRVGILAKSLHKYYVFPKSVSYVFHPQRVETDQILHRAVLEYLAPYGAISVHNEDFIFAVYLNAIKDTWAVLLNARIPVSEKLGHLDSMLFCDYTRQLVAREHFGAAIGQARELQETRKTFFSDVVNWLLSLCEVPDDCMEQFCEMGEFSSAVSEFAEGWIIFNKLRIGFLLDNKRTFEAKKRVADLEEILPCDPEILEYRKRLEFDTLKMNAETT